MADRTRSLASCTPVSGSPTTMVAGQTAGDVDLHFHQLAFKTEHSRGVHLGQSHAIYPPFSVPEYRYDYINPETVPAIPTRIG